MSKWCKLYFMLIAGTGLALLLLQLPRIPATGPIDMLTIVIMTASLASNLYSLTYRRSLALTLDTALTILLVFHGPLVYAFLMSLVSHTMTGLSMKYIQKTRKRVFDVKWAYNVAQMILLAQLVRSFTGLVSFELTIPFLLKMAAVVCCFDLLSMIATTLMFSLYSRANAWATLDWKTFLGKVSFDTVFTLLLFMLESSYHVLGVALLSGLLIPAQSVVFNRISGMEVSRRLNTDGLTGAFSRRFFEEHVSERLRQPAKFTLLFIDIDQFKRINNEYGHLAGDAVLKDFVDELRKHHRKDDMVFRYGGDEFCILIEGGAEARADALKSRLEAGGVFHTCRYGDAEIPYSISIGAMEYDGDGRIDIRELIDAADKRMYEDKINKPLTAPRKEELP